MTGENGWPETPDWTYTRFEGICPRCHERKFIGHGPLCVDCFLTPPDDSHIVRGSN